MDNNSRYNKLITEKERLEREIKITENRLQLKRNSESQKKRKARTRALIQKGALLDKYFDISYLSVSETEEFLSYYSDYIKNNKPERFQQK